MLGKSLPIWLCYPVMPQYSFCRFHVRNPPTCRLWQWSAQISVARICAFPNVPYLTGEDRPVSSVIPFNINMEITHHEYLEEFLSFNHQHIIICFQRSLMGSRSLFPCNVVSGLRCPFSALRATQGKQVSGAFLGARVTGYELRVSNIW